jgi:hypothetical protein
MHVNSGNVQVRQLKYAYLCAQILQRYIVLRMYQLYLYTYLLISLLRPSQHNDLMKLHL